MKKKAKNKAADLRKKIDGHIKDLAHLTSDSAKSTAMKIYLDTCARFYQYSPNNQDLISMFCPHATHVAGFRKWTDFNRFVRKGEQGIPILAPCKYKRDPDDDNSGMVVRGFRVVYVFDITQTDGEDIPPPPVWVSPERILHLENLLITFAASEGITVDRGELPGSAQGLSTGGTITLAEHAGTKTLIHEIAHELLHQHSFMNRKTKELEAEAVSFVVGSHFGLEHLQSPNYLALWCADGEKILERQDRIRQTASKIIRSVEESELVH